MSIVVAVLSRCVAYSVAVFCVNRLSVSFNHFSISSACFSSLIFVLVFIGLSFSVCCWLFILC